MPTTTVFDLDRVLLGGDASTLFLRGVLRQRPRRVVPLLLCAPLLLVAATVPQLRPLGARLITRPAVGGPASADQIADAFRSALAVRPEAAVADAIAGVRGAERRAASLRRWGSSASWRTATGGGAPAGRPRCPSS